MEGSWPTFPSESFYLAQIAGPGKRKLKGSDLLAEGRWFGNQFAGKVYSVLSEYFNVNRIVLLSPQPRLKWSYGLHRLDVKKERDPVTKELRKPLSLVHKIMMTGTDGEMRTLTPLPVCSVQNDVYWYKFSLSFCFKPISFEMSTIVSPVLLHYSITNLHHTQREIKGVRGLGKKWQLT